MQTVRNFINGVWQEAVSRCTLDVVEPATGAVYARVADSDAADIDLAVAAAQEAFAGWSTTPAGERARLLLRIADLIDERAPALARAESIDSGKPLALASKLDIPRAAANFRFFATSVLHWASEAHRADERALNYTLRKPRGVAGCISPWNLPLYLFTWKLAPALATGNTAVGKPSELTPMTAHLLTEVCRDAGLPQGVLNVVHGRGATAGAALVAHAGVPTLTFTGGTATGKAIAISAAPLFKRMSLELGGKNATVIFADADVDQAVAGALAAAFENQGEICLCGSRILVERPLYDTFVERLVHAAKALRVGDPLEPGTEQGALVSKAHRDKVASYVELAQQEGGTIHCGGRAPQELPARCKDGYFFLPTVITGLAATCRTNQEEIFGPVVTVLPFADEAEAVAQANSTRYGLAASLWTRDLKRAHRVADRLEAGTVWVNCWMLRDLRVPFGGVKESGVGREGGVEALRFFTEPKNVCVAL